MFLLATFVLPARLSVVAIWETSLAACPNAMPLHQLWYPLLASADAPVAQFSPDARPSVGFPDSPQIRRGGEHCRIAQVAALGEDPGGGQSVRGCRTRSTRVCKHKASRKVGLHSGHGDSKFSKGAIAALLAPLSVIS